MKVAIPEIPEHERSPLVLLLLDIVHQQQDRIALLEDEIASLKGLKPRPQIQPSTLETPKPATPPSQPGQRPGSAKRPKTAQLTIHREVLLPLPQPPAGAVFKGYQDYVVQDLVLEARTTRYRRERWRTTDGQTLVAALPDEVVAGSHFGPTLHSFALYQYHHQRVTQPLLREGLRQWGIDISAGQLNNLLTEGREAFHQEKEQLLPAGLQTSAHVGVDDTGARHRGQTGYCTHIGNEQFAFFESTDSKSRLNFLEILRKPHCDYVVNDVARVYWKRQQLSQALLEILGADAGVFADAASWQTHLTARGVTGERHVRIATEGALLGSLTAHGVPAELVILSDGAPQFDVLVHAACWLHAERPLARLVPYNEQHRQAIEGVRSKIWDLYQDLKAYQRQPLPSAKATLESQFDRLCAVRTGYPSVDGVLKEMRQSKADLLCVLEHPEVPLHNNTSERHIREYVTKRKVSGGTRSPAGRRSRDTFASLKKTCRALGVNFWEYLSDRVRGLGVVPRLAELIRGRATEAESGGAVAALA
jgi:Transposase IS66 family